ncbi:Rid family hydrolase [Streptomyces sp. NPDC087226]|jgi:enamine deaminase RidA (YjgF/YER057c/UK114 family)|uniref:Rid family hydrolase n=1 Tax=Streptomyces sp. NPDC087226 TaxID=3365771 RepID=UPI003808CF1C
MNDLSRIPAPDGVAPAARYTHGVTGTGRLVAVSGRLPLDEDGALVGEGDAGATSDDVVKPTFLVSDMAHLPAVHGARAAHVPDGRLPAMSDVQVARLARPQLLMEIEALAVVPA